ncbi:MarR family winged helix-turn-helix transcriptional regulator [Cryobacterium sp. PAMC25264]|uniref:MarR family winged helix-turn-helix transcriptional regulator n=1 Tax=Cryobacterium sp. PAMC25264 TaxID=2861288 RepID=UPI001C62A85A|nr:MarR family transcriptional regulator [Cryobacterium sp. PAMC25264]QYF73566.1 MarR family transcriptional regulator [Cryobacterium sp. PAMC25264]
MTPSLNPSGLSGDRLAAWASIATLLERLPAALDAQLQRDSGLTHYEHGLLFALDSAPGRSLRMSVLAGYASSTLSRLSRAISRLEKKGWVRREVDPTDGRFTLAILSHDGHALVTASTPAHHALVEELVFESLTAAQVRQLADISGRIATTIDSTPAWVPAPEGGN